MDKNAKVSFLNIKKETIFKIKINIYNLIDIECSYPCENCTGSADNCTSCKSTTNRISMTDCSCSLGILYKFM